MPDHTDIYNVEDMLINWLSLIPMPSGLCARNELNMYFVSNFNPRRSNQERFELAI